MLPVVPVRQGSLPGVVQESQVQSLQDALQQGLAVKRTAPRPGKGTSGGASGREATSKCRRCKRHGFHPWVRKIPWMRAWQPTPVFLPQYHRQRSLVGYSPWGHKELDKAEVTEYACTQSRKKSDRELKFYLTTTHNISSVQFSRSVLSDSLRPRGLQHARPPYPSPTPGVYSNSCPLSQ